MPPARERLPREQAYKCVVGRGTAASVGRRRQAVRRARGAAPHSLSGYGAPPSLRLHRRRPLPLPARGDDGERKPILDALHARECEYWGSRCERGVSRRRQPLAPCLLRSALPWPMHAELRYRGLYRGSADTPTNTSHHQLRPSSHVYLSCHGPHTHTRRDRPTPLPAGIHGRVGQP